MPSPVRASFPTEHVDEAVLELARKTLARGGVVAIPTETVYGLAARADLSPALARLRALKERPADEPLTWHVGKADALEEFPVVTLPVRRLAARYWPGPLTLVLPGVPKGLEEASTGEWTGVRLPGHVSTARLLASVPFPVVATSANRRGEPPMCDADGVAALFEDEIELLLDDGQAPLAQPSSVLRIGRGCFDLLREGVIGLDALRATAGLRIAFACTGNTCRSPMAEGLARALIAERLSVESAHAVSPERIGEFGFDVRSVGLNAMPGAEPSSLAVEVLREQSIDISAHRSRPASIDILSQCDRLYGMTQAHCEGLRLMVPPEQARRVELLDPSGSEIADPIGAGPDTYRRTCGQIHAALKRRAGEWV
jgi:tRNA threonylcarbamoyl adenosine modification protein (Sua5/YciO/YrdC/YwlC family)